MAVFRQGALVLVGQKIGLDKYSLWCKLDCVTEVLPGFVIEHPGTRAARLELLV